MTDPQANVEGPRAGDRVQVEAWGEVLTVELREGVPQARILIDGRWGGPVQELWLPVDMLVLLNPRTTP